MNNFYYFYFLNSRPSIQGMSKFSVLSSFGNETT
jgi:hypothetical protein